MDRRSPTPPPGPPESDPAAPPPHPSLRQRLEPSLTVAARALAAFGGIVLIAMALVTVYSIIGRALPAELPLLGWWRSVRGNFEIVELATAIAIFSFLPYTHLRRGNVLVDFFTTSSGPRTKAALSVLANLLFSSIALLFTWQMIIGAHRLMSASYTQTTMLLRIPVWYGYLPATIFMAFLSLVVLFTLWRSIEEALGDGEPEGER